MDTISNENKLFNVWGSGNWICERIIGEGILVKNTVTGQEIHLRNESNGWFTLVDKNKTSKVFNQFGQTDLLKVDLLGQKNELFEFK